MILRTKLVYLLEYKSYIKKMRDFLKTILAVICGMLVTAVVLVFLAFGTLGAIFSMGSTVPVLPKSGVLEIDMSKIVLAEQTREGDPFAMLQGNNASNIGIWDAVSAINTAAGDPAVKYIYLKTDSNASGVSALEEFRAALSNFRNTSGKPVVAYIESPSTGSYYLASVADKIYMTSCLGASSMLNGVSSQAIYLGDLLKKLGVNMQLVKHGKYKSAGEMYTRSSSTPENREQNQRIVDAIWETVSAGIAQGRGMSVEQVNEAVDGLKLCGPEDFLEYGFVDELMTRDGLEKKLAALAVVDEFKNVDMIPFADYVAVKTTVNPSKKKIAVIYAEGEIVDSGDASSIVGDRFASVIAEVRADSSVKAVVLRVNSPGGSVLASEKIKNELDLLKAEKPLVASYGAYAASGGYWISNNCDKIYSDACTLTGSIGVFGLVPDVSSAMKNTLHIGVESFSSNRHSDMYGMMRPFDNAEYAYMQSSIESIYDKFITTVSEGRSIPVETVDAIGQGRVWSGKDALGICLVDEIGTLEDAIRYAASCAGDGDLDSWRITGYPRPQSQLEMIMSRLGVGVSKGEARVKKAMRDIAGPQVLARMDNEIEIR